MSITTYVRKKCIIPVTGHTIQQKLTLKIMFTKQTNTTALYKLHQKNLELKLPKSNQSTVIHISSSGLSNWRRVPMSRKPSKQGVTLVSAPQWKWEYRRWKQLWRHIAMDTSGEVATGTLDKLGMTSASWMPLTKILSMNCHSFHICANKCWLFSCGTVYHTKWNCTRYWSVESFMEAKVFHAEAEIAAIENAFSGIQIYLWF